MQNCYEIDLNYRLLAKADGRDAEHANTGFEVMMSFDVICFDCDSTLSKIEGIDELARRVCLGEEMSKLTEAAMNGELPLEAVYERRLIMIDLIRRVLIGWQIYTFQRSLTVLKTYFLRY